MTFPVVVSPKPAMSLQPDILASNDCGTPRLCRMQAASQGPQRAQL